MEFSHPHTREIDWALNYFDVFRRLQESIRTSL